MWQRWLAHELLRLRTAAGLDRKEVAEQLHCTTQKIGHLETGTVPPKTLELEKVLLPLFGVPQDRWPFYLQAARDARKKGWWEGYAPTQPDWFSLYVGLEQGASEIHTWQPMLVHGLLQTGEYARAVMQGGTSELSEDAIDRRVEARLARQAILADNDPPRLWLVLGEAALHSNVGGPDVMRAQLRHLLAVAKYPRVTIQVLPGDVGAHPGTQGAFAIMDFPAENDPGLAYIEHRGGALYLEDQRVVKDHRIALDHLRGLALSPAMSLDLVTRTAKEAQ
ncbi:Putative DNA-binding protein [Alloactinosynnema sp. L-07]|nr:Putative DNA-binding protein [Alloactinosynnema sp. L-07]